MTERYVIKQETDLLGNQRLVVRRELTAADVGEAIGKAFELVVILDRNIRWEAANKLLDKANEHDNNGDFELVVAISTVLIANKDPQVHFSGRALRASALRSLKLYADAIEDYSATLTYAHESGFYREVPKADYASMFVLRGFCYFQLELFDAAARDLLKAVEISPALPRAWFGLGYTCYKSGQYEQAVKYFIRAEQLDKSNEMLEELLQLRAWSYAKLGQRTTAKADFDRLLQAVAARRSSLGYRELGKFHLFENDAESALACFNRAVAIAPHYSGNLEARADAHDKLGHQTQASSDRVEAKILKRVEETYETYFTAARQMWCNGYKHWFTDADTRPVRGLASLLKVDQSKEAKAFLALMQSQDQKRPMFSAFFQRYLGARQANKLNDFESDMYPMLRGAVESGSISS